ncbi:MAG: hypothetical protein HFH41_04255 [Lachnospiraceae bacterium]|nr:hypothetical protein [Lachnospiraceae bacterium]
MLYICLTFDYELFLGDNKRSEEEILFVPSRKIIDMLYRQRVSGTFFADVCSVFQYEKYKLMEYPDSFGRQIKYMNEKGQDVQLHLHPNWMKSTWENGKWNMDVDSYKLHYFSKESSSSMEEIFQMGKEYLEKQLEEDKDYKCIAYRAGGFCLQPEEKIIACMLKYQIGIESSVAPRLVAKGAVNDYDFQKVPQKLNWWINAKKGISHDAEKSEKAVFEVPVGTVRNNVFRFLKVPREDWHVPNHPVYGSSIKFPHKRERKLSALVRNVWRRAFGYGILSLDSRGYKILFGDLQLLYKKYHCRDQDAYVSLICHPKLADQKTIDNMENLIEMVKKNSDKFAFVNMREIYDRECM